MSKSILHSIFSLMILCASCFLVSCSSNSASPDSLEGSGGNIDPNIASGDFVDADGIVMIKNNSELVRALRFSGADAQATKKGVVINLPDAFFKFDRYVLTADAVRSIREISRILKGVPQRSLSIEGHTDYIGRVTYNKDLSLKRASSVASELRNNGVKGREMLVRGYGEGYPVATNNSELGRSRNRRVEIVISLN